MISFDESAPIVVPSTAKAPISDITFNYAWHQAANNQLTGYVKIKIDVNVALALAEKTPYPTGVKLAVMQQVANSKEITLEQMRILLGWAARKAQR